MKIKVLRHKPRTWKSKQREESKRNRIFKPQIHGNPIKEKLPLLTRPFIKMKMNGFPILENDEIIIAKKRVIAFFKVQNREIPSRPRNKNREKTEKRSKQKVYWKETHGCNRFAFGYLKFRGREREEREKEAKKLLMRSETKEMKSHIRGSREQQLLLSCSYTILLPQTAISPNLIPIILFFIFFLISTNSSIKIKFTQFNLISITN